MKMRKCPYCGRRISYTSSFASRRKAEYICQKCGKESKVAVDKKVILFFIVAVVISLAIMAGWILAGLVSNPLGILLVAIPLIIFTAASPNFVHYEPYKKYRKSMEAKKAGIAYSDNLLIPGEKLYLADLAAAMGVRMTELSKGIEKLQDSGFVTWKTDREAGRTYVELSSKAVELMAEEQALLQRCYRRMRAELGDEELRRAAATMQRATAILKEEREKEFPAGQ